MSPTAMPILTAAACRTEESRYRMSCAAGLLKRIRWQWRGAVSELRTKRSRRKENWLLLPLGRRSCKELTAVVRIILFAWLALMLVPAPVAAQCNQDLPTEASIKAARTAFFPTPPPSL